MKNYNIQGHPCGICEKAYAFALQIITSFPHFITPIEEHYTLFSRDDGQQAPSPAILVH